MNKQKYYKVTLEELQQLRRGSFSDGALIIEQIQDRAIEETLKELESKLKVAQE